MGLGLVSGDLFVTPPFLKPPKTVPWLMPSLHGVEGKQEKPKRGLVGEHARWQVLEQLHKIWAKSNRKIESVQPLVVLQQRDFSRRTRGSINHGLNSSRVQVAGKSSPVPRSILTIPVATERDSQDFCG